MNLKISFLSLLLAFTFFTSYSQLKGKVVGIADGDTFTLLTEDTQRVRVRLYGIDCPESKQDYGNVAKQFASDLIFKKNVYVTDKGMDKYGRTLGVVYIMPDSICLNIELLKAGLAWHYSYFDRNNPAWDELEQNAKKEKKGLWQMGNAVAPWNYRKENAAKN